MEFMCSRCGKPNPQLFLFCNEAKIPLCSEDVGLYIIEHGILGNTIFPISAISFIESPADQPLFEQRASSMTAATDFLTRITDEEATQWSAALLNLMTLREDLIAEVVNAIEAAKVGLSYLHGQFVEGATTVKEEFDRGMRVKEMKLSPLADVVLTASKRPQEQRDFFKLTTELIVQRVKKEIATSLVTLKSEDVVEFFKQMLRVTDDSQISIVDLLSSSEEEDNEKAAICEVCAVQLTSKNSGNLPGHRKCHFCYKCLESSSGPRLQCPVCKLGFAKAVETYLQGLIPDIFSRCKNEI